MRLLQPDTHHSGSRSCKCSHGHVCGRRATRRIRPMAWSGPSCVCRYSSIGRRRPVRCVYFRRYSVLAALQSSQRQR